MSAHDHHCGDAPDVSALRRGDVVAVETGVSTTYGMVASAGSDARVKLVDGSLPRARALVGIEVLDGFDLVLGRDSERRVHLYDLTAERVSVRRNGEELDTHEVVNCRSAVEAYLHAVERDGVSWDLPSMPGDVRRIYEGGCR
jgi:hypothetical protein